MCPSNRESGIPETSRDPAAGAYSADLSRVLVVGKSPINRVVVCKIVERCGLKSISESPDTAAKVLRTLVPGTIVLDGGADNSDCDPLLPHITALRRSIGGAAPCVILLSTKNCIDREHSLSNTVDEVVSKPIMPENLQPVIERLIARSRGRK